MKSLALIACTGLLIGSAFSDDLNQKGGGSRGGGGSSQSGGGSKSGGGGSHGSGEGRGESRGGGSRGGGQSGGGSQSGGNGGSRGGGGTQSGGGSNGGSHGGGGNGGQSGGSSNGGGVVQTGGGTRGGGGGQSGGSGQSGGNGGSRGGGGSQSGGSGNGGSRGGGSQSGGGSNSGGGVLQTGGGTRGGGSQSGGNSGQGGRGGYQQGSYQQGGGSRGNSNGDRETVYQSGGVKVTMPARNANRIDSLLQKKASRSGDVRYGTTHNYGGTKIDTSRPLSISRPPRIIFTKSLQDQVRREERGHVSHRYRDGYYGYNSRWCDDFFFYPYYAFNAFDTACVVSPWYYYPQLPGYINCNHVTIIQVGAYGNWYGDTYRWQQPSWNNDRDRYTDLDYSVDDIESAFMNGDKRAVNRLVPRSGSVNILVDGQSSYSLSAPDFYDMLMDASQNTDTRRYEIVDVRKNRSSARVIARHEFNDPFGQTQVVWHTFFLEYEGNNLVIRGFGTSDYRP